MTNFQVDERLEHGIALVRCRLETGRTHQVRVHLSEHGAPILGDPVYGGRVAGHTRLLSRVGLHAVHLSFDHPATRMRVSFEQPPPADFREALEELRAGKPWR